MSQPIVYVDVSRVREGKLGELETAMKSLARFVEEHMPRLLSYAFFLDAGRTTMTLVAVHPDSASLEFHMDEGNEEFRKFAELIDLQRIEVYGAASEGVLDRLHRKAQMLGGASVDVHELHAGSLGDRLPALHAVVRRPLNWAAWSDVHAAGEIGIASSRVRGLGARRLLT